MSYNHLEVLRVRQKFLLRKKADLDSPTILVWDPISRSNVEVAVLGSIWLDQVISVAQGHRDAWWIKVQLEMGSGYLPLDKCITTSFFSDLKKKFPGMPELKVPEQDFWTRTAAWLPRLDSSWRN